MLIVETTDRKISDTKMGDKEMVRCRLIFLSAIFLSIIFSESHLLAGPRVDIVIGEKAPALERLAADELAGQLHRIYEAEVKIGSTAPADSPHVIFVGSPDTNASMKPFADAWPSGEKKLSDQGHLLRSVTHNKKTALLVGGGSPVATYWAVAEFGHRLGIRSMLFGDLDPVSPLEWSLKGFDDVLEPALQVRGWHLQNNAPTDTAAWGLNEYRQFLRQLAKLKFNQVSIAVDATQAFVHVEASGIKRQSGGVWSSMNKTFPVGGDTAGRKVFAGAALFENPEFAGAASYEQRLAAGKRLLTGIIEAAHQFGLKISIRFAVDELPKEFAVLKKEPREFDSTRLFEVRYPVATPLDAKIHDALTAQWSAYLRTYPGCDAFDLGFRLGIPKMALKDTVQEIRLAVSQRPSFQIRRLFEWDKFQTKTLVPASSMLPNERTEFDIAIRPQHWGAVLPTLGFVEFQDLSELVVREKLAGLLIEPEGIGDSDLLSYWLSRAGFGQSLSLEDTCRQWLVPVCGAGIDERFVKALGHVAAADDYLIRDQPLKAPRAFWSWASGESGPPPESWGHARDSYLEAMNEMYRANTRAREGGRAFTLYLARRYEFAFEYLNSLEAARKSEVAELKKDSATQIAELEKAIESLNNALNAMAAVARSNSDRGLIAVLNEDGYRPLKKKLAEAEAAAK